MTESSPEVEVAVPLDELAETGVALGERPWTSRFLDAVERAGNRLPDPVTLFVLVSLLVAVASWLASRAGVAVLHPGTGATVAAVNLLSKDGLRRMLTEAVSNFTGFAPLGTVLVAMLGIGVAERSGLITTCMKTLVEIVPARAVTAALVFVGVNASLAADAGFVILVPLGAVLYLNLGRHPLAGLVAAFASVSGCFSANLFLTALDPLLSGMTDPAAKLVNPNYQAHPTANYYFMAASVVLLTAVCTYVSERVVEPRLGAYLPPEGVRDEVGSGGSALLPVTPQEKRAAWAALATGLAGLSICLLLSLPSGAVLRGPDGGLQPFYGALITLMMLLFFFPGLVYGAVAGTVKSDRDVARMTSETMSTMGAYIVLAFVAAQFVAYFSWSNLGLITAVAGAGMLKAAGISGLPLVVGLMLFSSCLNMLISSASAKWAILAPVFVPMLMLVGTSPELAQAAYRVGDSVTNVVSPLLAYYPLVIVFAQKYDPRLRLGTILSLMLPYAVALGLAWSAMLVVWVLLGIPLGPGAPLSYP